VRYFGINAFTKCSCLCKIQRNRNTIFGIDPEIGLNFSSDLDLPILEPCPRKRGSATNTGNFASIPFASRRAM